MGKKLDKFLLLMWKNWKLQYRRPLQTTVEIAAPILFSILLVILRSLVDPEQNPTRKFQPFDPLPLSNVSKNFTENFDKIKNNTYFDKQMLVYSPTSNAVLERVMKGIKTTFKNVKGYKNSKQLEQHFQTKDGNRTFAAIQFDDNLWNKNEIPQNITVSIRFPAELRFPGGKILNSPFKITNLTENKKEKDDDSVVGKIIIETCGTKPKAKLMLPDKLSRLFQTRDWKTNLLYSVFEASGPRDPEINYGASPNYYLEGFLALQVLVTQVLVIAQMNMTSLVEIFLNRKNMLPTIQMQRFPFASWNDDPLLPALISFIGMLIMLSFVYTCINTVKVITSEKEKQLKEAMKIMGLPNWLHWSAWFAKSLSFLLISVVFIVFLLKIPWYPNTSNSVFTYADPLILFLFLLLYMCATITFCFSVSVFFSKANTASTVAGLLWFLSYAPYLFLQSQYDQLNLTTKLVISLGANTAMAYGFQLFLMFESTSEGIHWYNIWTPNSPDDTLTLGLTMTMLAIDAVIYLCIALYVEAVFPGEFGTPQPWYFPLTYSYWCGKPRCLLVSEDYGDHSLIQNEFFEQDPVNLKLGIQIKNLRKVFGKKVAVNCLSLKIYDDQITVLLGHNGAGKTTTMSMLTGIIPASNGTAFIRGFDIRTSMKQVRANLGLCPQHNILFDDLTVGEHLFFFSKLKGLHQDDISAEINKYVRLLELEPKINKKSNTLSGGMKRKLCVGIALCGESKVVLLDEPTAGMDPSSRRALWDLLQTEKKGRCILLTTHYMDEADLLGDRIAIMANGGLKCCGTSFFLKKKFGTGYHLILDKLPNCDPDIITQLLQKYIPHIRIQRDVGSELVYLLKEEHSALFESMLNDLENNTDKLKIRSYGISLTTLEDVFMKVGSNLEIASSVDTNEAAKDKSKTKVTLQAELPSKKLVLLTGSELIRNQFIAMFMKKSLSIIRTWLLQFIQILIPVAFLIVAMVVSRNMDKNKLNDLPKLKLTLRPYTDPVTLIDDSLNNTLSKFYFQSVGNYKVENVTDVTSTMLNLSSTVPFIVKRQYLVGATLEKNDKNETKITAWFNNNPFHTPPLALGLVLNAIYKSLLGENYSITFINHPLPFTDDTKIARLLKGNSMGFQIAFNVGFSMSFVSSFYVLFYVKERVCKSKHLQFASGVQSYIFWITAFVCDLATFMVTIVAILLTLLCFQEEGFNRGSDLGRFFCLLFYFGFAMLPMMYLASYLFDIPSTGYTRMALFSVFTGVTAFLVVQILSTPGLNLTHIANALHWGFLTVPHYSLATGIRDTYITYATRKLCEFFVTNCLENNENATTSDCWNMACNSNQSEALTHYCCEPEHDYFKWESPGVGKNLLYSFTLGAVLFILLNLSEQKLFVKLTHHSFHDDGVETYRKVIDEDDDVIEEKKKIRNTPEPDLLKENSLVLKDVSKYYKKFLAVNRICLAVKQYECFGLLGVNGAGKTSTFKMITGDTRITHGNAWIHGFSIKTHLREVQKVIGYCPQFDALLTDLTAKETLIMFALLRGVPLRDSKYVAEKLAEDFDFYQHLNKQIKHLSGGNKRKISTAVSLTGDPPVICLDEPTAGMDPLTKRNLWNALCTVRNCGKCILFTSHSMEECEALCTRLAIMVNGDFKCIGSLQHLKNKFAAGYTLTLKTKRTLESGESHEEFKIIEDFIVKHFPTARLQEKHQELISYYIADTGVSLSKMFGILENAKHRLNIEDYSLGQASLEQIFLTLTKYQR